MIILGLLTYVGAVVGFAFVTLSLACGLYYLAELVEFPDIELSSPAFILSCILVISDHFVWFFYFTDHYHTFFEIATFFGLVVWLIPFMYFISLSANEYTLPNFDASAGPRKKNNNLIKTIAGWLGAAKQVVLPESSAQKAF
ncbi:hypothetical protein PhCBS80983_g00686 [Powellomyces hirtus]|uniref:Protein TEX261 n=1 Tax=Powellomyces hirtus TaxID=109895 RepID=A0A507EDA9_9FUNG|nr:hypothetical protein PhCBS80983_g00686 [Powellomyces hirtus]